MTNHERIIEARRAARLAQLLSLRSLEHVVRVAESMRELDGLALQAADQTREVA